MFFDFIRLNMINIQAVCSYIQSTMLNEFEMWEASSSRNEAQSLRMKSLLHRYVWNISGCFGQQRVVENHLERFDPNVLLKMFSVLSVCPENFGKAVIFVFQAVFVCIKSLLRWNQWWFLWCLWGRGYQTWDVPLETPRAELKRGSP